MMTTYVPPKNSHDNDNNGNQFFKNLIALSYLSYGNMGSIIPENVGEMVSATKTNDIDVIDITPSKQIQRTPEDIKEEKLCILEQVEYYFGDENLPKDKFLMELCSKDPKGWVPLAIVRLFKKMQVYKDDALIVEALRESPEILEVDDSGMKIRRKSPIRPPIPKHIISGPMWRTIFANGFDTINKPSNKSIEKLFKKYGNVVEVIPRKDKHKKFKGSYYIQFETHREAKSILKKGLRFKGANILIMMKFDYCEMKCVQKGLHPDTIRKVPTRIKNAKSKSKLRPSEYKKNCLLRFEGAGPNIRWIDVKTKMKEDYGNVMFVKLDDKPGGGIIEFEYPIALRVSSEILNDNLDFDGLKPVFTVLQGEDEKNYYLCKREFIKLIRNKRKHLYKKLQRKVEGEDDAEISDCSSTSVDENENKLDDTTEAEMLSAIKPKLEEIVVGNKHKHDTTEAEMSPEINPKLEETVIGTKRKLDDTTEAEMSPEIKVKLEETIIGNKPKLDDTTEAEMSPAIKVKLEKTVIGNKPKLDDTIEAEMSPAIKVKLEETVIGNKSKLDDTTETVMSVIGNKPKLDDTTEAEMSPAIKVKLEKTVIGNKRKLDDIAEAEMSPAIKVKLEETVIGNKPKLDDTTEAVMSVIGNKPKLDDTTEAVMSVIGNKPKLDDTTEALDDTTEAEMSPAIKPKLEETVIGNKRKLDDTTEAEMSPATKQKLEETVIGNKRKHDTTEAEMSLAIELKLEETIIGNKPKLDDTIEAE
ncbi:La-domain-containing protein [Gigaspora margarita]|uniref:La-domain-containing protein n=1 Tax=Gigaspora margarita TaxID=4874 RepID=A0A8H4ANC4_GIGMA|nr:La-domain-containing protein [Gigaspora margarita]